MIDLRSDTLTTPTPAMRRAIADAEVGDDVYGEDPTVTTLEAEVAAMFGHEAGLFCPTGSLANLLGIWLHTEPGTEVLCDAGAHIVRAELGAHALWHGVTTRTWASDAGRVDTSRIEPLIADDAGPFLVRTACLEVESSHNFGGGTIQPLDELRRLRRVADAHGLAMHLDGARIWNSHVATGVPLAEVGGLFDTVSVCFSKGLGAPIGSMLLGSHDHMARARLQRKRLGGGWRQAGLLAAGARYAVHHHVARLADDHAAAAAFAEAVNDTVDGAATPPETNIVVVDTGSAAAGDVVRCAESQGVRLAALGPHTLRAVTHLDVSEAECERAGRIVGAGVENTTRVW